MRNTGSCNSRTYRGNESDLRRWFSLSSLYYAFRPQLSSSHTASNAITFASPSVSSPGTGFVLRFQPIDFTQCAILQFWKRPGTSPQFFPAANKKNSRAWSTSGTSSKRKSFRSSGSHDSQDVIHCLIRHHLHGTHGLPRRRATNHRKGKLWGWESPRPSPQAVPNGDQCYCACRSQTLWSRLYKTHGCFAMRDQFSSVSTRNNQTNDLKWKGTVRLGSEAASKITSTYKLIGWYCLAIRYAILYVAWSSRWSDGNSPNHASSGDK